VIHNAGRRVLKQLATHVADLEGERSAVAAHAELLERLGAETLSKWPVIRDLIDRAAEINPNDPPAALKRALSISLGDRDVDAVQKLLDKLGDERGPDLAPLQLRLMLQRESIRMTRQLCFSEEFSYWKSWGHPAANGYSRPTLRLPRDQLRSR
jgi:hypothetical protein